MAIDMTAGMARARMKVTLALAHRTNPNKLLTPGVHTAVPGPYSDRSRGPRTQIGGTSDPRRGGGSGGFD